MTVIDVHGHIGHWQDREITASYILRMMDENAIDLAIVSNLEGIGRQTDQTAPNARTLAAVRAHVSRLRGLVWINPWQGEKALADARRCLEHGTEFVGLKFHPYHNRFHFNTPKIIPFIKLAGEFKVPLAIHTAYDEYSHPDEVIAIASDEAYREVNFILYHAGLGPPNVLSGDEVLYKVAPQHNLYIDISWVDLHRLRLALRIIPLHRILYGTDLPLGGEQHYKEYTERLNALTLSKEELIKLKYINALAVFRRLASAHMPV